MSFAIEKKMVDGVAVVGFHGRLTAGEAVEAFRSSMDQVLASGNVRIALDLSQTDYIDSSGLGTMVMAHSRVLKAGGRMTIFGMSSRHLELMIITKLTTVFEMYDDEIGAVNACIPGREVKRFDLLEFVEQQRRERDGE
jgi:anti-sigma B factor antagonist